MDIRSWSRKMNRSRDLTNSIVYVINGTMHSTFDEERVGEMTQNKDICHQA